MDKLDVIDFFDKHAPSWDAELIRNDSVINKILNGAEVRQGSKVLDVACGTGVLIPDYLKRDVSSVLGVDISPKMIEIAAEKFKDPRVKFICTDVETLNFSEEFDCCVVYNAFPHFPDPASLIRSLAKSLKVGGTLTIAHGMSRAKIDSHHSHSAGAVSVGLMHEDALAELFLPYFEITVKISDDTMYQVTGKKK